MKIKFLVRKNLKMSPGKTAAQVGHVAANLAVSNIAVHEAYKDIEPVTHIVLGVSNKKFDEKLAELVDDQEAIWYVTVDAGFSEVPFGTKTVLGFVDEYETK